MLWLIFLIVNNKVIKLIGSISSFSNICSRETIQRLSIIIYVIWYFVMFGLCFTVNPFPIIMLIFSTFQITFCLCIFKRNIREYKRFLIFFPSTEEDCCSGCLNALSCGYLGFIEGVAYGEASYMLSLVFVFAFIYFIIRILSDKKSAAVVPSDLPQTVVAP